MKTITRPLQKAKISKNKHIYHKYNNNLKKKYKQSSLASTPPSPYIISSWTSDVTYLDSNALVTFSVENSPKPKKSIFKELNNSDYILGITKFSLVPMIEMDEGLLFCAIKTPQLYLSYYINHYFISAKPIIPNGSKITIIDFDHTSDSETEFDFQCIIEYDNKNNIHYGRAYEYSIALYEFVPF